MAIVTILTHGNYTDKRSKVVFNETVRKVDGVAKYVGVAEVPDDVAREYFVGHDSFLVELLEDEPAAPEGDQEPAAPEGGQEPETAPEEPAAPAKGKAKPAK